MTILTRSCVIVSVSCWIIVDFFGLFLRRDDHASISTHQLFYGEMPNPSSFEEISAVARTATNVADKLLYEIQNFKPFRHNVNACHTPPWDDETVVAIGIPTSYRVVDYLTSTLDALAMGAGGEKFFIYVHARSNVSLPPTLGEFVEAGRAALRTDGPPPPAALARRWGDSPARVAWRSAQAWDVSRLVAWIAATHRGEWALLIEDDAIALPGFLKRLRGMVGRLRKAGTCWTAIESFSDRLDLTPDAAIPAYWHSSMIGVLVRVDELRPMAEYLRRNFDQSPVDWLFVDYVKKIHGTLLTHGSSLFIHAGVRSTFSEK